MLDVILYSVFNGKNFNKTWSVYVRYPSHFVTIKNVQKCTTYKYISWSSKMELKVTNWFNTGLTLNFCGCLNFCENEREFVYSTLLNGKILQNLH